MIVLADRRPAASSSSFADDVRAGLSKPGQKELPSKYLYDAVGSALFDAICALPEYGLARAGERVIRRHAEQIVSSIPAAALVAELGSGSARNTRWILEAMARRQAVTYYPIDISRAALVQAERELSEIPALGIVGFEREYLEGLDEVAARRQPQQSLLVLFLGGTIGNFDRPAGDDFLRQVRRRLRSQDRLLLSTDLVKPEEQLLLAYDDPAGVTSAFDKNLLARINRELGGTFDLRRFHHVARWDAGERRIEMHLRSSRDQRVRIDAADLSVGFTAGETIWTESSHKYEAAEIAGMAARAGFRLEAPLVDVEWGFAQNLLVV
jgi:dimethylhistidine N-methyltransferase